MLSMTTEPLTDRFLRAVVANIPPEHVAGQLDVPLQRVLRLLVRYRLNWSGGRYVHHLATRAPVREIDPDAQTEAPVRARVLILPGRVRFPDGRMLRVHYAEYPEAVRDTHPGPMPVQPTTLSAIGCSLA